MELSTPILGPKHAPNVNQDITQRHKEILSVLFARRELGLLILDKQVSLIMYFLTTQIAILVLMEEYVKRVLLILIRMLDITKVTS